MRNSHTKQEDIINEIFNSFSKFKKHIWIVFKDINTEWTVEQELMSLQQWEFAVTYVAKFQRIAFNLVWEDISLTAQFYWGLKNSVKDDIVKTEQSETL